MNSWLIDDFWLMTEMKSFGNEDYSYFIFGFLVLINDTHAFLRKLIIKYYSLGIWDAFKKF